MGLARRFGLPGLTGIAAAVLAVLGGCDSSGDDACAPIPLEEGCARGCPSSPDDVELFCASDFKTTTRGPTACGGSYVKRNYGLGYTTYYFNDHDELVGIVSATDAGEGCMEGNGPITTTFGDTCRATGEAVDLCKGSGGDGSSGDGGGAGGVDSH